MQYYNRVYGLRPSRIFIVLLHRGGSFLSLCALAGIKSKADPSAQDSPSNGEQQEWCKGTTKKVSLHSARLGCHESPHWCQHAVVAALLTLRRNLLAYDIRLIFLRAFHGGHPGVSDIAQKFVGLKTYKVHSRLRTVEKYPFREFKTMIKAWNKRKKTENRTKQTGITVRNAYWLIIIIFLMT